MPLNFITVICLFATLSITAHAQRVSIADLSPLFDRQMSGELIYLDYQSNKEVSIPVKLTISKRNDTTADFAFQYPGEANANNIQKVRVSKDGSSFNDEEVTERVELKDGGVQITTTSEGKDDGKKATFTTTYIISPAGYSSEKLVNYGTGKTFLRNRFVLKLTE